MDSDRNTPLNKNIYISKPEINQNYSDKENEEFRKYYENDMKKQDSIKIKNKIDAIELKNTVYDEKSDNNNLINTNGVSNSESKEKDVIRTKREIITPVSIDSRGRDKTLYPKPNNFNIFLDKTFYNVKKIKLISLEFPNTDAVINSTNNTIYWQNQEDIDNDITVSIKGITYYPVYSATLRIGSYTVSSLQTEITSQLNKVRRTQGVLNGSLVTGSYHFFVVSLDINTDIVTFTSLIMSNLGNNPLNTTVSSGVIIVNSVAHGYSTNSNIYMYGLSQIAGIPTATLNGFHLITRINADSFSFQVNVQAGTTTTGGGNTCQSGKQAPFRLLWGEYNTTVAQNIGYPLEDSSQFITTNISSLQNFFQMTINTIQVTEFTKSYTYIGQQISIGYFLNNIFIGYSNYIITDIPGTNSILVSVPDNVTYLNLINNSNAVILKFGNNTFDIYSFENYTTSTFLISCYTNHNYLLSDIGNNIILNNTADLTITNDTSYDGTYTILGVPTTDTIIVPGVLGNIKTHSNGNYGTIPRQNPITSWIIYIQNIYPNFILGIDGLYYTKIVTQVPNKLYVGDYVKFNNIFTSPLITKSSHKITSVNTMDNSFLIQFNITNVDTTTIINNTAFIGTGLITVSFPSHTFNTIISISNGVPTTKKIIRTFTNNNIKTGDFIRLSNTQTTPSLDGGGYIATVISNDTFSITNPITPFTNLTDIPLWGNGNYPILGLNNNFYLYGVSDIGGISSLIINNTLFTVRDIIDIDTFTFMINNTFATSIEQGGGSAIFTSSLRHGFNGIQTNTKNGLLNRSINLEGENYAFLTCPTLGTVKSTGLVSDIFAKLILEQSPGYICTNYISNPKIFDTVPLNKLADLTFSVYYYNNSLYAFQDLDFSFTLEITEVIDEISGFNISSRRGIVDTTGHY
jgi:hypothetical protein